MFKSVTCSFCKFEFKVNGDIRDYFYNSGEDPFDDEGEPPECTCGAYKIVKDECSAMVAGPEYGLEFLLDDDYDDDEEDYGW